MTVDKFGRHISQLKHSSDNHEDFLSTSIAENIVNKLYYNVILTFESTAFLENSKKYLISDIKTCHTFFYESAITEYVIGCLTDTVKIVNKKEFTLTELNNIQQNWKANCQ